MLKQVALLFALLAAVIVCSYAAVPTGNVQTSMVRRPVVSQPRFMMAQPRHFQRFSSPRTRMYAKNEKEVGLVPDTNVPDADLVPADGGLLDSIFNKWLCKASPTRVLLH
mmetsp:Transcript_34234/g.66302  ORF Transcript_34234/g.66302 Transcript_34234/m.66302 type:complete len:110 (+) Transcript_34234:67-396(+)